MELMVQLSVLTGMQFSSPTGIIGSYNHGMEENLALARVSLWVYSVLDLTRVYTHEMRSTYASVHYVLPRRV